MPIHINLLAETQAAEEMRRRDPVKRFIFFCVSIVAFVLMVTAWMGGRTLLAKEKLTYIQQKIDAKTNAFQHAQVNLRKVADAKLKLAALEQLREARFLQGNLLNALQQATMDDVQLTKLQLEQSYDIADPDPSKPGKSTERIILHLSAKDFSDNPGDEVNKFKDIIADQPYFQKMLNKTNAVELTSPPSAPQTDSGKPYVTFTLDCYFNEHTR